MRPVVARARPAAWLLLALVALGAPVHYGDYDDPVNEAGRIHAAMALVDHGRPDLDALDFEVMNDSALVQRIAAANELAPVQLSARPNVRFLVFSSRPICTSRGSPFIFSSFVYRPVSFDDNGRSRSILFVIKQVYRLWTQR